VGRSLLWDGSLSSPFTAHSSESFSVQGRDGGEVSDKEFLEVFFVCSRSTDVGARREGCGRLLLLGVGLIFSWYSEIR